MSLQTNLANLITRLGTEFKAHRTLMTGSGTGTLTGLTTTDKTSLVAAINEVQSEVGGGGGATNLDGLSDVVITSPVTGHVLRHNGTNFVNVVGLTYFEAAGAAAAAQAASQPLDGDLTSIAALTTTSYGRAFLALADQAALMGLIPAASETVVGKIELATQTEVDTGTDAVRAITPATLNVRLNALVNGAPGLLDTLDELAAALGDDPNFAATIATNLAGKQPIDTDLTAIAALTSAANQLPYATGAGTWSLTTLTAFGRSLIDDADAAAGRTTLDVYSKTEMGNPETDLVAVFEAALL